MPATKLNHDAMNSDVMTKSCSVLNLKPGPTIVASSAILMRHFQKTVKKDDLLKCEKCGGLSSEKFDSCPYCGEGGVKEVPASNDAALATNGASNGAAKVIDVPGETVSDGPAPAASSSKKGSKAKPKAAKAAKAPKAKPAAAKKGGSKGTKPAGSAALAKAPNAQSRELLQEHDLDEAVARILELKAASAMSLWELGQKVREVYERELWLQRTNESGKPRYKRFQNFCESELGLKRTTAYALMEVAKEFDAKTLAEVGIKKLSLIVGLPPEQREPLLNRARNGASARTLASEASTARGNESREVSMMIRVGERVVIPLVKAGERRGRHPVAHTLADHPWGVEKHENGIQARYSIQAGEGGALELVIERRRGDQESAN